MASNFRPLLPHQSLAPTASSNAPYRASLTSEPRQSRVPWRNDGSEWAARMSSLRQFGHRLFHFRIAEDDGPSSRSCSKPSQYRSGGSITISIWASGNQRRRIKLRPPVSSPRDWACLDPDCFSNDLPQRRVEPNGNIFRWCEIS